MHSTEFARLLRKSSPEVEHRFWFQVRNRRLAGYKFRRQLPVGPYIVDFVCEFAQVIVEIDGGQHAGQALYDMKRDAFLREQGYAVLRFWNNEGLENMDGVLSVVLLKLAERPLTRPSGDLSHRER